MVFFVVSTFRVFVIKDLFLFRFIRVGRKYHGKNNLYHTKYILWTLCDEY